MDELIQIKVKYFRQGNIKIGDNLADIIKVLENYPELQEEYLQQVLDLEHSNNLTLESSDILRQTIINESKKAEEEKKKAKLSQPENIELNKKRKKVIFKILDEYQRYIHNILLNKNEDPQFNSITHSFATELSVKFLFAFTNINEMVDYLVKHANLDSYIDKNLTYDDKNNIVYHMDMFLISLDNSLTSDYKLQEVLTEIQSNNLVPGFLRNIQGRLNNSSHSNIKYIDSLPEDIKTLINYYTIKYFSNKDLNPNKVDEDQFDFIDYFLMIRDFRNAQTESSSKNTLNQINSERFLWSRYTSLKEKNSTNYQFVLALAMASFSVFRDVKERIYKDNGVELVDAGKLSFVSKLYTSSVKKYLDNDIKKQIFLCTLNDTYPELMSEINDKLSPTEFESFIKKFSISEIDYLFKEVKDNPSLNTISDLIKYTINFKNKVKEFTSLKLNDNRYARINKLFKVISESQDIRYVGFQLRNWIDSISLHDLTPEEMIELNKIDPNFIYSQLDYKSQLIYKKCEELNIPYRYYYRRFSNSKLDFLFNIYKEINAEIPLVALYLSNLQIMEIYEDFKKGMYLTPFFNNCLLQAGGIASSDFFVKKINPSSIARYHTGNRKVELSNYCNIPYAYASQLKDTYLDAEFETISTIVNYYNGNIDKINNVPNYVILASYTRLSYLLNQVDGDLDSVCKLPFLHFAEYLPEVLKKNNKIDAVSNYLGDEHNSANYIIRGLNEIKIKEMIKVDNPELQNNFEFVNLEIVNPKIIKFIRDNVNSGEQLIRILELFSTKDTLLNGSAIDNKKFYLPNILGLQESIFKLAFDAVKGDFINSPENTVNNMKDILKILTPVKDINVLEIIALKIYNKSLKEFTIDDYISLQELPNYLLSAYKIQITEMIETYEFEKSLQEILRTRKVKEGIKLLGADEVQLSYYRLLSFIKSKPKTSQDEAIDSIDLPIETDYKSMINLEPLMYIDYNDICHLINMFEEIHKKDGIMYPNHMILYAINYIASKDYKIDVHTLTKMNLLQLISLGTQRELAAANRQGPLLT